jgi:hypothetical protein
MQMANEVAKKYETAVELADTMLEQTTSSVRKLLCKKGKWSLNGEEIPIGKEFVAYPFDARRGVCRWEDERVVEEHTGRIADKSVLKVEGDQLIFNGETFAKADGWQPQYAMLLEDPKTGEVVPFVSCATGAKIAIEKLIHQTASAIKKGGTI